MPALRLAAACLVAACSSMLVASAQARPAGPAMIAEFNELRTAHGLRALRYSRSLARTSFRYSRLQLRRDRFGHSSRIMASSRFARLGEILALVPGRRVQARRTLQAWLDSPSHRAVVLNRAYRYAGSGWSRGRMGARRAVVWTAQFGR